jgi:hypothetical protein
LHLYPFDLCESCDWQMIWRMNVGLCKRDLWKNKKPYIAHEFYVWFIHTLANLLCCLFFDFKKFIKIVCDIKLLQYWKLLHWWVMNTFFSDLYNLIQYQSSFTMLSQLPYSYKFMYFYSNKNTCCWWALSFLIPMLDSSSCDPLASSRPLFPPFNFDPSLLNLDQSFVILYGVL